MKGVTNEFVEYVTQDLLSSLRGITARAMFGGFGIYKDYVMFGIVVMANYISKLMTQIKFACPIPASGSPDYLGGVLGGAPGNFVGKARPPGAQLLCGHSSPPSGRGILAASNKPEYEMAGSIPFTYETKGGKRFQCRTESASSALEHADELVRLTEVL